MINPPEWQLEWLTDQYAVCRMPADSANPEFTDSDFVCLTRTDSEVSLVISEANVPPGAAADTGWHAMRIVGTIPFETIGLLATLTGTLAEAGVSVFAVSTFDTDYVLVKDRARAQESLESAGFLF